MTTPADTLRQCHAIVWKYREELKDVWPTPTRAHSLIFALSELGEVADAMMRTLPQYARNNERATDVLDEWADVALMCLTALGKNGRPMEDLGNDGGFAGPLPFCAEGLGLALVRQREGEWSWRIDLMEILNVIVRLPGMDLPARLQARLERIKAKRLPNPYPANGTRADIEQWAYRNFTRNSWEEYNERPMSFEAWQAWTNEEGQP